MFPHKFRKKETFYVAYVKKDLKKCPVNSHIGASTLSFLRRHKKMLLFLGNLCTNIECPDVNANIFSNFFDILKCVFK
jgi:hypothetical protein